MLIVTRTEKFLEQTLVRDLQLLDSYWTRIKCMLRYFNSDKVVLVELIRLSWARLASQTYLADRRALLSSRKLTVEVFTRRIAFDRPMM